MASYKSAIEYLYAQLPMFHRIGAAAFKKDLSNTIALCEHLGHPEKKFPSVHIAGTNGKGSVAHFLAAFCTAAGLKTGLYTSPHYRDFRERIKINGEYISKREVARFVEENKGISERIKPSFFEWTVALAFDYFSKQKVDIAIIETGMGGRLDSTNVITPLLSIITNISFDHQQFLGDTLPKIAGEKAGIIKPGIPVVIGESQDETNSVFQLKAKETGSSIYFADKEYKIDFIEDILKGKRYRITHQNTGTVNHINLNHEGIYQSKNLVTTLKAVELLAPMIHLSAEQSRQYLDYGMANLRKLTNFLGRWEIIHGPPDIIMDSAHNEAGLRLAVDKLKELQFNKLHFIYGTVSDKSLDKILPILPPEATYYFAKANIPRGLDARLLKEEATKHGLTGKAYSSVRRALQAAKKTAKKEDLIFVSGSIFVVAEVI